MDMGNLSRRGFLQRSLGGLIAAGLPAWYAQELLAAELSRLEPERKEPRDANSRIQLGIIGSGDRLKHGLLPHVVQRHKDVFQVVAVCDVDRNHREEVAKICEKRFKVNCAKFEDFRDLCTRKDVDAVLVVTPDHWHALASIAAMKAKKDVYCEKPLSLTVEEGKAMVRVARANNIVFQVGSQQRSEFHGRFRLACELVRNGRIGKVKTIETRIDSNPQAGPLPVMPVPEGLNWDFWLGQTPMVDYVQDPKSKDRFPPSRCHYQFRWWYEYSGGKMTDWGAHHNDIAQWALGMDEGGPVEVEGEGTPPNTQPNCYNVHEHFKITYTYADGTKLFCMSKGENGIHFEGEDGKWIFVNREKIDASDKKLLEEPLPKDAVRLYAATDHMGNWKECLQSRKRPICDIDIGHHSITVCHIGVIALRSGKKLRWDPLKMEFIGDGEANGWLSRKMRDPWRLEV
jgi:predicted dehydrogenase